MVSSEAHAVHLLAQKQVSDVLLHDLCSKSICVSRSG